MIAFSLAQTVTPAGAQSLGAQSVGARSIGAPSLGAQSRAMPPVAERDTSGGAHSHPLTRHPAASIALIGAATTLALRPLDESITDAFRAPSPQGSAALRHTADLFNAVGGIGFVISSATLIGTGYASRNATITQLGVRTAEAMALDAIVTSILKGAFGRQRPFVNEETPSVFALGRGYTTAGRTSFPSGHASSSFAFAAALTTVLRARKPKAARFVGPLAYGTAALVGVSRVYGAHHWASDISAGATVGMLSAWVVTRRELDVGPGSVRWRF